MGKVLAQDIGHVLRLTGGLWEHLRDKRLFLTGGTGFFGRWLLESFAKANEQYKLNSTVTVLTRDINKFKTKAPHLGNNPAITFQTGDVKNFPFPEGKYSYIIHAAADFGNNIDAQTTTSSIVEGTKQVLAFASQAGIKKFLYISSGAVYGKQPADLVTIPEDYRGTFNEQYPKAAYANAKTAAEHLCLDFASNHKTQVTIARCFAFVGPFLPPDAHFAVGNFIRDALLGRPIVVNGDGTPVRSYLYASDLAVWLWTILLGDGIHSIYNVGSEEEITIADLARLVAEQCNGNIEVHIGKPSTLNKKPERFVPSTIRAREDLRLTQTVNIKEAIAHTIEFYLNN
jgi:nucleoside-diphosphate-sugar epimerase